MLILGGPRPHDPLGRTGARDQFDWQAGDLDLVAVRGHPLARDHGRRAGPLLVGEEQLHRAGARHQGERGPRRRAAGPLAGRSSRRPLGRSRPGRHRPGCDDAEAAMTGTGAGARMTATPAGPAAEPAPAPSARSGTRSTRATRSRGSTSPPRSSSCRGCAPVPGPDPPRRARPRAGADRPRHLRVRAHEPASRGASPRASTAPAGDGRLIVVAGVASTVAYLLDAVRRPTCPLFARAHGRRRLRLGRRHHALLAVMMTSTPASMSSAVAMGWFVGLPGDRVRARDDDRRPPRRCRRRPGRDAHPRHGPCRSPRR